MPGIAAKILAATIFAGCAWTDCPDMGMSVMITADGSRAAARAAAVHLARRVWEARRQFAFGCETAELEEGVARALAAKESTVFLTDSGDNVTASTPGDLPIVLRHLVERKVQRAVVAAICDEAATRRCCEAGPGKRLKLSHRGHHRESLRPAPGSRGGGRAAGEHGSPGGGRADRRRRGGAQRGDLGLYLPRGNSRPAASTPCNTRSWW